jgi:RHS repeat-associated protein
LDNPSALYLTGDRDFVSRSQEKTWYHYASDEQGSILFVTDEAEVKNRYEYDAWGNAVVCEEQVENRYRYTGQQYDPVTQQYYLRARYYNPVIARFTQEDEYRGDGLNLYAYCANNPVVYVDPSGYGCEKKSQPYEGSSNAVVKRTGPKGVDPNHHNANVMVRDVDGKVISHERVVSGNMTVEEKALGFPKNTLASHTEARAVTQTPLKEGQTMTITGQRPPCPSCKGYMNRAMKETGADIRYQWRQDGKTQKWP